MRAARIENGLVVDLWEVPSLVCYGSLYVLAAAPDDVQMGASYADGVFTNPPPPPKTREQRIAEINAQRDAAFAAGLTFNDQLYHTDALFQSQLQAFVLAWQVGVLAPTATVAIRLKDNVTVQMTRGEVTALAAALMQFVQDTYAASWAAKDALT